MSAEATVTRTDLVIGVGGVDVAAWHYPGQGDAFAAPAGRPCVVMAHGFGATRDSGLEGFADAFAAAGLDVVVFDYRQQGASGGEPRQVVIPKQQREDYAAVIAHARGLDGIDPERIVAWGVSFAGGHVFRVAAEDARVAAVVALTPAPDGLAVLRAAMTTDGPAHALKLTATGLRDAWAITRKKERVRVPAIGRPGELAALTAPGALEAFEADIAGPGWTNAVCAHVFLEIGANRPGTHAAKVACPTLVQIADDDRTAPPGAAMKAAVKARAEVRHYPCDHFDVYPSRPWHAAVVEHQLSFLHRRLLV